MNLLSMSPSLRMSQAKVSKRCLLGFQSTFSWTILVSTPLPFSGIRRNCYTAMFSLSVYLLRHLQLCKVCIYSFIGERKIIKKTFAGLFYFPFLCTEIARYFRLGVILRSSNKIIFEFRNVIEQKNYLNYFDKNIQIKSWKDKYLRT